MKKVYNSNGNYYKIYNKDCLIQMKKIKDKSIDLILCDLPYGTTDCSWDTVIPFKKLWKQYKRIIKDYRAIVLFGSEPFSSYLRMSNLKWYKYDWIWYKNKITGFTHSKNMPLKDFEIISVFSNGVINHDNLTDKRMIYNPQGLIYKPKQKKKKTYTEDSFIKDRPSNRDYVCEYINYPKMHLNFNYDYDNVHPTQKPVELLEYLIKTYSNENDLVLDNTMGSGSTGVACINTKRNFIGIELEKKYYKIAKKRLSDNTISLF